MPIYEYYCPDNHRIYSFYAKTLLPEEFGELLNREMQESEAGGLILLPN